MERRDAGQVGREGQYLLSAADGSAPNEVHLWQREVHRPGIYDLEVDTSLLSPEACAAVIRRRLDDSAEEPMAFQRLALPF